MVLYCSVPQCNTYASEKGISFHKYPKCGKLQKAWLIKLRMGKPKSSLSRVCSKHFKDEDFVYPFGKFFGWKKRYLAPGTIPSECLPVRPHDEPATARKPPKHRQAPTVAGQESHARNGSTLQELSAGESIVLQEPPSTASVGDLQAGVPITEQLDHLGCYSELEQGEDDPSDVGQELQQFMKETGVQVDTLTTAQRGKDQLISVAKVKDESALLTLTGIGSFQLFYNLTELYTEIRLLKGSRNFCISDDDAVLLSFIKLYTNISFSLLSILFGIHRTTVANIFKESVQILSALLKNAVFSPDKEAVFGCLTKYFDLYRSTRMVLDCTEVPLQQPRDLQSRILTYSYYKKMHTLKVLVSETPGGLISYVSPAYGGRASDTHITKESGVLDFCEPFGDSVMVDKGFLIERLCDEKNIRLIRPPFLRKKQQFTTQEAMCNQSIASARVHVERAIQRMKLFKILKHHFQLELLPYVDDIFIITAGIANLSKPLFSSDKFLFSTAASTFSDVSEEDTNAVN